VKPAYEQKGRITTEARTSGFPEGLKWLNLSKLKREKAEPAANT